MACVAPPQGPHPLARSSRQAVVGGINALSRLAAVPKRGIRRFQTLALEEEIVDFRPHSAEEQFGGRRAQTGRTKQFADPRIRAISLRMFDSVLRSSGTSPNLRMTFASPKSPMAGSPVRLKAIRHVKRSRNRSF